MLLLLAYKAFLDIVFYSVINPVFSGEVYFSNFEGFSFFNFSFSYVCLFFCLYLLKSPAGRVSRFFFTFQVFVFFVPYLVLFGQLNYPVLFLTPLFLGYFSVSLFINILPSFRVYSVNKKSRFILIFVLLMLSGYLLARMLVSVGLQGVNFNLREVYEFRDGLGSINFLGSGLISGVAYIVNVGLMIYFLQTGFSKRASAYFFMATLVLLMQVLFFGLTNYKSYLFIIPAALGLVFLMRFTLKIERVLVVGVVALVTVLLALGSYTDVYSISMIRRALFVPPGLTALYYEFFTNNDFTGLGIVTKLVGGSNPEMDNIRQVAYHYWGKGFSPNVEWVTDAYTKLGLFYVVINAFVLAVILRMGDVICNRLEIRRGVAEALMLGPCITLSSGGLITAILSHGLILVIPVLWLLSTRVEDRFKYN